MSNDNIQRPSAAINRHTRPIASCPNCLQRGRIVPGQTVKALVSVSLRGLQDDNYYYCPTPDCPIVYYTYDGSSTFTTAQLRERVYQKEPGRDEVKVCYCFGHTAGEIQHGSAEEQHAILEDITAGIQADQCACDIRNPQGSCCLGTVRAMIKAPKLVGAHPKR